jgi:hypothetical protein
VFVGNVYVELPPQSVFDDGVNSLFVVNQSLLMYVEPGQKMTAQIIGKSVGANMTMLLSGYLVDLSK